LYFVGRNSETADSSRYIPTKKLLKVSYVSYKNYIIEEKKGFGAGSLSKSREPGGSETFRYPLEILLLELMKAYIF
jgi:hypothetical protein